MKPRHSDLQELCHVIKQKVPESIVEAVCLAVEAVDDDAVALPGAIDVAGPRIDELSVQLAGAMAEVILLPSKS